MEKKINAAAAYAGISQAEVARRIRTSPQQFNKRMKRAAFTDTELSKIAAAMGAEYESYFVFPDGTRI